MCIVDILCRLRNVRIASIDQLCRLYHCESKHEQVREHGQNCAALRLIRVISLVVNRNGLAKTVLVYQALEQTTHFLNKVVFI